MKEEVYSGWSRGKLAEHRVNGRQDEWEMLNGVLHN
jgi:hypothetical protein